MVSTVRGTGCRVHALCSAGREGREGGREGLTVGWGRLLPLLLLVLLVLLLLLHGPSVLNWCVCSRTCSVVSVVVVDDE